MKICLTAARVPLALPTFCQEAVKITRTTGLRTFAREAGVAGTLQTAARAFGKATLRSYAAQGLLLAGGVATAAIVYRMRQGQAAGTTCR
jgi:hypothetical protein